MNKSAVLFLLLCLRVQGQNDHPGQLIDQVLSPRFVVNFDYKSYQLNAEAQRHLDSLIYLIRHESFTIHKIEISGHCDSVASNAYNDVLSLKRAKTVGDYFRAHGVKDSLIKTIDGHGKREPLNNNADSLQRLANRRVEIVFQLILPQEKESVKKDTVKAVLPVKVAASVPDSLKPVTLDVSNLQVNDLLELENINFYPNRHLIMKQSKKNLEVLLNTMLENKTLRIEIRGHVCCLPDYQGDSFDEDTYKEDLSLQRAKAIFKYLVENGVEPNRMTYIGLGARYPKVKEFTEADKAKNRRVEIKILSK